MQLLAARIALLAYLVGGLAIPAMHQHGWGPHAAGHSHAAHSHAAHSHAAHSYSGHLQGPHSPTGDAERDGECCHATAPAACDVSEEKGLSVEKRPACGDRIAARTAVAATLPHSPTCGEDCVICGFIGSAQASVVDAPPSRLPEPLRRLAAAPQGPGFAAADLRIDRLRGPPLGVILG